MNINEMNIEEVEKRLSEINEEIETREGEELEGLKNEVVELQARKKELKDLEERQAMAKEIEARKTDTKIVEKGGSKMPEERTFKIDSKEYREAYLKKMMGRDITEEERAGLAMSSSVPYVEMQKGVIAKAKEYAPIIGDVTLIPAKGYVKFAVEGNTADAADHTENAAITAAADTLVEVELTPKEITKLIQVSESVATMSVEGFEQFIIDNLGKAIAAKIENKIVTAIQTAASSVATSITTENVLKLFGSLAADYARSAKVLVNRGTFYGTVLALQDKAKNDLVTFEAGVYKLLGVEVEESSTVADGTLIICDPTKFVAALAEDINVKTSFDIDHNSRKYLGVAEFDGKVAVADAFKKIANA